MNITFVSRWKGNNKFNQENLRIQSIKNGHFAILKSVIQVSQNSFLQHSECNSTKMCNDVIYNYATVLSTEDCTYMSQLMSTEGSTVHLNQMLSTKDITVHLNQMLSTEDSNVHLSQML